MKISKPQKIKLTISENSSSIFKQNKSEIKIINTQFIEGKKIQFHRNNNKIYKNQKYFPLTNKPSRYIPYRSLSGCHKYRIQTPPKQISQIKLNFINSFMTTQSSSIKKQIRQSIGLKHLSLINLQTTERNKSHLNRFRPNVKTAFNDYYITQNPIQQNKQLKIALNNCQKQNRMLYSQLTNLKRYISQSPNIQTKRRTLSRQSSPYFSQYVSMPSNVTIIEKFQKQQLISVKTIKTQSEQMPLDIIQSFSKKSFQQLKLLSKAKIENQSYVKIQSIASKMQQELNQIKQIYQRFQIQQSSNSQQYSHSL